MAIENHVLLKIGLALLVGGLVGAEREYRDKAAGFRTMIFICLGAALFTMHSISIGVTRDQARIAAAIVSGVGFLGGGAIMRGGMSVQGLTTAATIWLTAALGMGIGAGYYNVSLPASAAVLVVLWLFPLIERRIDDLKTSRVYEAVATLGEQSMEDVSSFFIDEGLRVFPKSCQKRDNKVSFRLFVTGSPAAHDAAISKMLLHDKIEQLTY